MPQDVKDLIKASPAERMVMLEQCETIKTAVDAYIAAVQTGKLADLPDRFYDIQAPHEYLAKVLSTRIEAALHESHQQGDS
jgi:hypothetical protein